MNLTSTEESFLRTCPGTEARTVVQNWHLLKVLTPHLGLQMSRGELNTEDKLDISASILNLSPLLWVTLSCSPLGFWEQD
jgi:hypothetical protein